MTVLNGHIHQLIQKVEGNVTFHTRDVDGISAAGSRQRAFAGTDGGPRRPTPLQAGLSTVTVMQGNKPLAFVDKTLAG